MIPVLFRVLASLYSVAVGASVCMLLCGSRLCEMGAYAGVGLGSESLSGGSVSSWLMTCQRHSIQ